MYNTFQNKNSNKSQTDRKLKHYIGDLSDNTTKDDLYEFFGLHSTNYLKENCWVKMSTNSKPEKKEIFCLCRCAEHVTTELIKLNGIQFSSKCIIVEEAKQKPTAFSEANILRTKSPVFGKPFNR